MRSAVHTISRSLADYVSAWENLHAHSPTATLFNHPLWATLWWDHFGQEGDLRLFTVEDDSDGLLGLAPFYVDRDQEGQSRLRLIGGVDVADYLDILVSPGREAAVAEALLDLWAEAGETSAQVLDLHSIPEGSPTREVVSSWANERGFMCQEAVEDVCPVIRLPDTWDAYLASLKKKHRHEVRRKRRKAERTGGMSWFSVTQSDRLAAAVEDFIALHQISSQDKEDFMTPAMQDFFRELATKTFAAGWLKLIFLKLGGQLVASYFCFDYKDDILVYNSGYDPALAPGLSPGIVLITNYIEEAIRQGRSCVDFLRGDEVYKFRLGATPTHVYQITVNRSDLGT